MWKNLVLRSLQVSQVSLDMVRHRDSSDLRRSASSIFREASLPKEEGLGGDYSALSS